MSGIKRWVSSWGRGGESRGAEGPVVMEDSGSHRPEWLQAARGTGACGTGDRPRDQAAGLS